jgi:hypothetical protein
MVAIGLALYFWEGLGLFLCVEAASAAIVTKLF